MTESNRIRVVIVDDDVVLADALHQLWERDGEISIVGVAHTAADGVVLACRERPDVILMDHHLPDMTGASAASAIAAELPSTPIVVLTRDWCTPCSPWRRQPDSRRCDWHNERRFRRLPSSPRGWPTTWTPCPARSSSSSTTIT
jgi:Response regulator receiver domain